MIIGFAFKELAYYILYSTRVQQRDLEIKIIVITLHNLPFLEQEYKHILRTNL